MGISLSRMVGDFKEECAHSCNVVPMQGMEWKWRQAFESLQRYRAEKRGKLWYSAVM